MTQDAHSISSSTSVDKMSNLPEELLSRIISLLPTKDAAATRVVSKQMRHAFTWMTSIDLNDLHLVDRFPEFKKFVDNVLEAHQSEHLARFRLHLLGGNKRNCSCCYKYWYNRVRDCCPDVEPTRLSKWICFPLARTGLRELDLFIYVRKPGESCKLPPAIFACETLEVLKINSNLKLDIAQVSLIRLPRLRLLHLCSIHRTEDGFLTRLVATCPSLEDLDVSFCWWEQFDFVTISSPSLRRLVLDRGSEEVLIDTPNLQYFSYTDYLARRYSFANANALVEAVITILYKCLNDSSEVSFRSMLNLIRAISNVEHLSLFCSCLEILGYGELKDQLPQFRNLKHLVLGGTWDSTNWVIVFLEVLNSSPYLETLAFPEGLAPCCKKDDQLVAESDCQCWRTTQAIPSCCRSYLKRIVIKEYRGLKRELKFVKFFLEKASVLEELVVYLRNYPKVDPISFESTLKNLPRASMTCSLEVLFH